MTPVQTTGFDGATIAFLLAHGAGAPMDSAFLNALAEALAAVAVQTTRFEFAFMAARRTHAIKRPPTKIDRLAEEYVAQISNWPSPPHAKRVIGGKSMGGRVASLIADTLYAEAKISGLICLGYPFHPAGQPGRLRTAHLTTLLCPTLIIQGDRDPLGNRTDVESYTLSPVINMVWLHDGDHDFKPRKLSGTTQAAHITTAAAAISAFAASL
jgi:uncharacterized protein